MAGLDPEWFMGGGGGGGTESVETSGKHHAHNYKFCISLSSF